MQKTLLREVKRPGSDWTNVGKGSHPILSVGVAEWNEPLELLCGAAGVHGGRLDRVYTQKCLKKKLVSIR